MEVLYPRCAGLDVHAETVVACVRVSAAGRRSTPTATVATTTRGVARTGAVAERSAGDARGDGSHRRLLEAGVARARGRVHADPRQCDAHPEYPRAQERHERRHLDRRPARARADPQQFCPPAPIQALRDLTRTRSSWSASWRGIRNGFRRRSKTRTSSSPKS